MISESGLYRTRRKDIGHVHDPQAIKKDQPEDSEESQESSRIICLSCKHPITHGDSALSVMGSHQHTQCNPAGIFFQFSCYNQASGCLVTGEATAEFSWFPGYFWQFACCSDCGTHLGWFFSGGKPNFFGLLNNKLTSQ
ncbi:cereblon family protein [Endozoicomonas arenosclerae]|uniref:cereblon family protein n=1 Tax=Endozoicomonas arenosclerae TaxID=1633495 RepID=UPI0007838034|nr:cereblon family protein [Endozoicomonas arenosclerae]